MVFTALFIQYQMVIDRDRMETVSANSFFTLSSILLTIVFIFYLYLKYTFFNVWTQEGVPHERPTIPFGNVPISYFTGKSVFGTIINENYVKFKKFPFSGLYLLWEPVLVINDPELIRFVLVKNFTQFYDRGILLDVQKDPLSASLDRMSADKWKELRGKLTPAFSPGKLKLMYDIVQKNCYELISALDKALVESNEIEFKDFIRRYTVDCISSIAYGLNADSLRNPDSPFLKYGRSSNYIGRLIILFTFFAPQLIKFIPLPKERTDNQKFFTDLFVKMAEHRRKENISRDDILNIIIRQLDDGNTDEQNSQTSDKISEADKLSAEEAVAQAFVFFAAGQESTSSMTAFCLYELALNPIIQQKLYDEINEVHNSPDALTFDKVSEMQYFDMVFQETLRKYPSSATLNRICTEDFEVPNSKLTIKKGTRIIIPHQGMHADPDIYYEPQKFDPTRFTPENKAKRHNFTFLPFGDGPRQCIARRLGTMKVKMALYHLLLNYEFSPCDKTPHNLKFRLDYFLNVPCAVPLKIERRNNS